MRSLTIVGALLLVAGIVLIIVDLANPATVCTTSIAGWESCKEHTSNRGLWIVGGAVLLIVATFVAWSTLAPSEEATPSTPRRSGTGRGLAIVIGVVFVVTMGAMVIDMITS